MRALLSSQASANLLICQGETWGNLSHVPFFARRGRHYARINGGNGNSFLDPDLLLWSLLCVALPIRVRWLVLCCSVNCCYQMYISFWALFDGCFSGVRLPARSARDDLICETWP